MFVTIRSVGGIARKGWQALVMSLSWRTRLIALTLLLVLLSVSGFRGYQVGKQVVAAAQTRIEHVRGWLIPVRPRNSVIAPLFSPEVLYWEDDLIRWGAEYDLDPNLLATVMQIESCGHPTVNSYAGAQGLFQVMPFHFADGENMLDPNTNAMRGARFLKQCIGWASGDIGLALACYNGGPSVINARYWDQQVINYYRWGVPIYADALVRKTESDTLNQWMAAGGQRLCYSAAAAIGLQ